MSDELADQYLEIRQQHDLLLASYTGALRTIKALDLENYRLREKLRHATGSE